jgi:hypothetical protein
MSGWLFVELLPHPSTAWLQAGNAAAPCSPAACVVSTRASSKRASSPYPAAVAGVDATQQRILQRVGADVPSRRASAPALVSYSSANVSSSRKTWMYSQLWTSKKFRIHLIANNFPQR